MKYWMPDINNRASGYPQVPWIIIYAYNFRRELSELFRALVSLRVTALPRAYTVPSRT
jgi:hypothetical protein